MMLTKTYLKYIPLVLVALFLSTKADAQATFSSNNSATATGTALGATNVTDVSNSGTTVVKLNDGTTVIAFPMIGIAKSASTPSFQTDGSYNVDYTITIKNFGNLALSNVQVTDLLSSVFTAPVTFTLRSAPTKGGASAATITLNAAYDGKATNPNLLTAATSTLPIGGVATITIPVNIVPNATFGTFNNTANAAATTADNTPVSDVSTNGSDPDAGSPVPANNGDLNPFNNSVPTPITLNAPDIKVTKVPSATTPNAGSNITFTITVQNIGTGSASGVVLTDILNAGYTYVSHVAEAGTTFTPGTGSWAAGNLLTGGAAKTLTITVKVVHAKTPAEYENTASTNHPGDSDATNNSVTVTTVVPVQLPPNPVNDSSTGNTPGANAVFQILSNDKLSDNTTTATTALSTLDLDVTTAGVQTTRTVTGEGVWSYDPATGIVTFDPNTGFTVNPTPINYTLTETATNKSANATITVTYVPTNPDAVNDSKTGVAPGVNAVLNLLTNDKLADGSTATTALTDVDLDLVTAGVQHTRTVTGEGVWTYDPATGEVTFDPNTGFTISPTVITYRLIENISGRTDDATITVTYTPTDPDAVNDSKTGVAPGVNAVLNLLTNDKLADASTATTALTDVDLDLVTAGIQHTLTVTGEGVWTYDPATGNVTFDPNTGFTVNPTVITYKLIETASGRSDNATITVTYTPTDPDAVNDSKTGVVPGVNAVLNLLTNDKLADASAATTALTDIDLDLVTAGIQHTLNVTGEGVWTYDPATGDVTFDPNTGFTVNPTVITYKLIETASGRSDNATITVTYVPTNPDAVNDASSGHTPGANATLNLLTNDKLADGSAATIALTDVDLDLTTAGVQHTRTVTGEGVWTYDPATGNVTFDPNTGFTVNPTAIGYRLIETASGRTDDATITVTYVPTNPDAVNDASSGHTPGANATLNLLTNDKLADASTATTALTDVDLDLVTAGVQHTRTVTGEGVWTYDPTTGNVTFDPNTGFTINPTVISYRLIENISGRTDDATITVTYVPTNPDAVNDASSGHTPGANATLNLLANDKLADASTATTALTDVDLDLVTAGVQHTRTVTGEGVWTYDPTTGNVTFDPNTGFTVNPTAIDYQLIETASGRTDNATITVTYVPTNPDAVNDASSGHTPGANVTLNLLTNDKLADGSAATTALTDVDLDLATAGVQHTRTVTGEGVWTYDPTTGNVTFDPNTGFTVNPTVITYRLIETISGRTDDATITVTYVPTNPDAVNDALSGVLPGANAVLNLLTNDKLADGSAATTALTDVDIDLTTAGVQHTRTVTGEGVWTYDPTTGNVTFDPNTGFTVNPTVIGYRLIETISGRTDDATITVTYVPTNPDAVNDASSGHTPGANATLNLLTNDKLADGSAATTALTTVDLDLTTAGVQTTLTVTGEGVWTYDPATGNVTFDPNTGFTINPTVITYRLTEMLSGRTDDATITVTYVPTNPDAVNDALSGVLPGANAVLNLLTNDKLADGSAATTALTDVDLDLVTAGVQHTLTVTGEGVWTYDPATGNVTFDPNTGFTINPTVINYRLIETISGRTDDATITVTYVPTNPDAVNDALSGVLPGANAVLNLLTNDKLADASAATTALTDVDLDLTTAGVQHTLTVTGEGVWTYDPATGNVTFDPNTGFTINPTVISYRLIETISGRTDDATITVTYVPTNPDAVNDSKTGVAPGVNAVLNLLTNDKLADGSAATTALTDVDLDLVTAGVQHTLTVTGEGVWTYDPATGNVTFDPNTGFTINPTVINYRLIETISGRTDDATITVTYVPTNPDAVNDALSGVLPGANAVLNLLTNDKLADGSAATTALTTIDLDLVTPGTQTTLTVAGEGVWTYDPATGQVTFDPNVGFTVNPTVITYRLTETISGRTDDATITVTYVLTNPDAVNDTSTGNIPGVNAVVNILTNDKLADGSPAVPSLITVDIDPSTPGVQTVLTVPTEGVWTYDPVTGNLTFDPNVGFTISPTPIPYELKENITGLTDQATVIVTYVPTNPDAVNDSSTGHLPGTNAVLNLLTNDKLADGSTATPTLATVDLDLTIPGVQTTRTVAGEGVWTYDPATGNVTFDPNTGFTVNPTVIGYRLIETVSGRTDDATITVTYVPTDPDAVNDSSIGNVPGANTVINILTNDKLADGSPATPALTTVDLDPITPGVQLILTVPGEGVWTYNPATGDLTFDPNVGFTKSPTPIPYTLTEVITGRTDVATVTINYTLAPPDAINDSSLNNTPGSTVSLNIMANDKLADASAVTLPLVTVDLDLTTAGIQTTRTVAGEGVWTYNAATGSISFAPYAGYTINPTPIPYQLTEVLTGLTDNAVVTITYLALNPDAINDASSGHNPGTTASLNLLTNDKLSDGTAATAALVSVDLDLNTPGVQTTLTVTGEGTWTYNPATGIASFAPIAGFTIDPTPITYRLIENITGLGDNATITITYVKLPPDAINDTSTGNTPGSNVTINILTNDKLSDGTAVALSRITVDLDLATPGIQTTRTVAGEGVWTYNASTGNITFDPNPGFTIDPTPITYRLIENSTLLTDDALITITYIKLPPDAVNDFGTSTAPGVSPSVNILTNDKLSDGSPVTIGNITIDLDINTPGTQNTLVVAGEGTWTYNPATGVVTFTPIPGYIKDPTPITYRLTENSTGLSDTAVITMTSTVNLSLGLAKAETNLKRELNGSFTITYLFTVKNHGNVPLVNVSVIDNLRNVFKLPMEISVRNVTTSGTLKANTAYTGVGNNELLAAGSTLPVGKTETIQLVVNVLANGNFSTFLNTAMATANGDQVGGTTTDVSTNGTNTDPNGNNVPTDANEDVQTPVTLTGTDVVIPGGFSPNGDGINDKLVIENTENKRIDLEIYNRWGNIVYKNKDYKNEWDGVCNTGIYIGQQVPDGTYYYIVRIEGEKRPVKFITINR